MSNLERIITTNQGRNVPSTDYDLRQQQVTQATPGNLHRLPIHSTLPVNLTGNDLIGSNEYTQEDPRLITRNDPAAPAPNVNFVTSAYGLSGAMNENSLEAPDTQAENESVRWPKVASPDCGAHIMSYSVVPRDLAIDSGMPGIRIWHGHHSARRSVADDNPSGRIRLRRNEIERQGSILVGRHSDPTMFSRSLPRDLQVTPTVRYGKNKGKQQWNGQPGKRHGVDNRPKLG